MIISIKKNFSIKFQNYTIKGNCWLELKSRYILQNEPYLNNKSINRMLTNQLETDCLNVDKDGLFKMFSTVLGINLAALISIIDSFNAICMHCLVLKWFYEHIFIYLFNYTASFTCQKQPESLTNNLTTLMAVTTTKMMTEESTTTFMLLLEITTHLIYFFMLKLIVSNEYRYFTMLKRKFQNVLQHFSSNGRYGLAKIGAYYLVFYVFTFVFLYLTLAMSPALKLPAENKCEHFFKNKSSQSVSNRTQKLYNYKTA